MNYKKLYKQFIHSRKSRSELTGYSEEHHILPRCMMGKDDDINLVKLTAREHYFAHALLHKIYNNYQMAVSWYFTAIQYNHAQHMSEYKIQKASDSRIGKTLSPEHLAKMSAALKGKKRAPPSPETRAKMSAAGKKRGPISEATRAKLRGPLSPETRAKMSASRMGKSFTKGIKHSAETRAKISASMKRYALKKKLATL